MARNGQLSARIPIDAVSSTVDHFIAGIGADPTTSGANAHLTVVYYYYPVANCTVSSCELYVGFTTSQDGGSTWTAGQKIDGPMKLAWLPVSDNGYMVADYVGVSYVNGNPFGVFAIAKGPSKEIVERSHLHHESAAAARRQTSPLTVQETIKPVPNAKSDYARKVYYDDEGHRPIPESDGDSNQQYHVERNANS